MALDTEKREVLTAAALAHLVDLKKLTTDDPAGKEIVECWRRLNLDSACQFFFDRGLVANV